MHKTPTQNPKPIELSPKNKKRPKKSSARPSKSKERILKPLDSSEIRVVLSKRVPIKKGSIDLQKQSTPKASKRPKKKLFINTQLPLNLNSDIDKSCSRFDKDRARSNLEYSLKSKLNLSQKVLLTKNTSPKRVEQIIKNSLKKDRRDRIMKEKELKQKKLQDEIKKLENDYQNNLIRKINSKKTKNKKISPEGRSATGRGKLERVVRIINKKLKSGRSVSTRRVPKDFPSVRSISAEKDRMSKYFADDLYGQNETCREHGSQVFKNELASCRTEKEKVKRNVSLIEDEESSEVLNVERNTIVAKKEKIDYKKYLSEKENFACQQVKKIEVMSDDSEELRAKLDIEFYNVAKKKSEEFRKNRAARTIQKAIARYLKKLEKTKREEKENKLQNFVSDQISWRQAQLLSLDYLREKELQDLQSLAGLLGQNPQLQEHLMKVVNQRYELFTKLFKDNLETAEQEIMQNMDTRQVLSLSTKIKDKKDEINKMIEETNFNSSLSKDEVESILKEVKDLGQELNSISCQTSIDLPGPSKATNSNQKLINEAPVLTPESSISSFNVTNQFFCNSTKASNRGTGLKILTSSEDAHTKTISINDILFLDSSAYSPTLDQFKSEESPDSAPNLNPPSTSPLPARPSAPLMFLDNDDTPLDSVMNFSLPLKKTQQVLPLLNLGSIQGSMSSIPITSDPRIETSPEYIRRFLSEVFSSIDLISLKTELKRGSKRDPLKELRKIREQDLGFTEKEPFDPILNIKEIIENFEGELSDEIITTQRLVNQADKIHKVMILSVADEAMQVFRPYGLLGVPLEWSEKTRKVKEYEVDLKKVINRTIETVEEFARFEIGKIPTEEMIQSNGKLDEELIQDIREDALGYAIKREIIDFDWVWTEYEFEETQVKIDLADMILAELAEEVVGTCS